MGGEGPKLRFSATCGMAKGWCGGWLNEGVRGGSSPKCYGGVMKTLLLLASAAMFAATSPALAKPGKGHGNPHAAQGHVGCPPGLAKKNNGCLPPGQAKKLFAQGQRVPNGYNGYTPYGSIPYNLRNRYDLNDNYRYIYRDDYIYQVDPATLIVHRILNAIL